MEIHFNQLVVEKSVDYHHIEVLFQGSIVYNSFVVFFYVFENERHDELDIWTCFNHIEHFLTKFTIQEFVEPKSVLTFVDFPDLFIEDVKVP